MNLPIGTPVTALARKLHGSLDLRRMRSKRESNSLRPEILIGPARVLATIAPFWPLQGYERVNYGDSSFVPGTPRIGTELTMGEFSDRPESVCRPVNQLAQLLD